MIVKAMALSLGIPLALMAGALVWPLGQPAGESKMDFAGLMARKAAPIPLQYQKLKDGTAMPYRAISGPSGAPLLVMIHGSAWHGMQFEGLAGRLSEYADILAPDLRGHGASPQRRGDVDYIGQFEDDLAELIAAQAKPGQKVVLLGHSSGGGLVIRFAGGPHGGLIAGAVLLAPFVHHAAPTTRPNSGGWAKVNLPRVIALSILNRARITVLNHLPIIRFAMPRAVLDGALGPTVTGTYSYRLNTSFAPRDNFAADIAALPPYLLLAGAQDESFVATAYAPLFLPLNGAGEVHVLPNVTHLDIVDSLYTADMVAQFLARL